MDVENSPEKNPVEVTDGANENDTTDPSPSKGVKRLASTPPEKDVKKQRVEKVTGFFKNSRILQLSPDQSSPQSVEILDDSSPTKKDAPDTPKTPKTPKISKEEREKLKKEKLEEKEKQKAERERLLEEKRLEKEKLAEEKRLEKEKKEKERLEKKAEEDRKKEEKRKEAEEKKKKEEEERVKKEEEKNKKKKEEEEKKEAKRKEEEEKKEAKRKEEEAAEEKKKRESARFLGFFKKEKKRIPVETQDTSTWYRPFERKDGMTIAPITPRPLLPDDFDFWSLNDETVTIQTFIDSAAKLVIPKPNPMKAKLFQFHENRRPWYYGTWRKQAKAVRGWCPLEEEEGIEYDVDSDEEWEDEPSDCEECNSDDDGDKDEEDENEEDDGFFVPPCYLSDGEGEEDSTDTEGKKIVKKTKRVAIDSDGDDDDEEDGEASNETEERKARMAQRASEWSKRTEKKKLNKLEPRAIGPVYPPAEAPVEFAAMAAIHFY